MALCQTRCLRQDPHQPNSSKPSPTLMSTLQRKRSHSLSLSHPLTNYSSFLFCRTALSSNSLGFSKKLVIPLLPGSPTSPRRIGGWLCVQPDPRQPSSNRPPQTSHIRPRSGLSARIDTAGYENTQSSAGGAFGCGKLNEQKRQNGGHSFAAAEFVKKCCVADDDNTPLTIDQESNLAPFEKFCGSRKG